MPTASTAQIFGNTECFEPITSNIYVRRVLSGEFAVWNKYLVKDLILQGLWTETIRNQIIAHSGSIQNITEILCRRKKNNPILIGEPGVGKSALIEGLAQQIVSQDVSDHLLGHTIYGLDLGPPIL